MLRDVGSNSLPTDRAVIATKVVIICRNRDATMARVSAKARPAGCRKRPSLAVRAAAIDYTHERWRFPKLVPSVKQKATVMQGGNFAHRRTTLTELNVKSLRERTGPTHADFSQMIGVGM